MLATKKVQYSCAVALILTSIVMVAYQVIEINDVANGLLFYVGQAFLLAGSIFGLDYYVDKIRKESWGQEESRESRGGNHGDRFLNEFGEFTSNNLSP